VLGVPGRVYVQELPGGSPQPLTPHLPEVHSVAWSPDGRWLAYVEGNFAFVFGTIWFANEASSSIMIVSADGGEPRPVTANAGHVNTSPTWGPDGRTLFWISNREGTRDIYRARLSGSGEPADPPLRLTTGLDAHGVSLDGEGTRLAYTSLHSPSNIWVIDVPRGGPVSISRARPVTAGSQTIEGVDVSADGEWLVFDSNRGGNYDVYRMSATGGEAVRLTTDPAGDHMPRWSPDGSAIVFHSLRAGHRDVYTIGADGTGETQRTNDPAEEVDSDWAGADAVVYGYFSPDTVQLHHLTLRDGTIRRLPYGEFVRGSPDGAAICYTEPTRGLNVLDLASGDARLLVRSDRVRDGPQYCAWGPDSRTIYYLSSGPPRWSIWSIPARGGRPTMLVDFDDPTRTHTRYGFTTDGRRFYLTLGSHESDVWVMELEER